MDLAIVGGGLAGASAAVQAARMARRPLRIAVFEPASELGRGLAYRTADPDHRINAHMVFHAIDPADIGQAMTWAREDGVVERDPEAVSPFGLFPRRADFGRYLQESVQAHMRENPSGSEICHLRERVVDLQERPGGIRVRTGAGAELDARAAIVAIGNPPPRVPAVLAPLAGHPALVLDPFAQNALAAVDPAAPVLVMGSSLTAADMLATLLRRGHKGPLLAFSRHGLRPRPQRPPDPGVVIDDLPADWLATHLGRSLPDFLETPRGTPITVRFLTRALRTRIRELAAQGQPWQLAFDDLRDAVWRIWPRMAVAEKRRFLAKLRGFYDVHRFRIPPQTQAVLDAAEAAGRLRFARHALESVQAARDGGLRVRLGGHDGPVELEAGALLNCTGLDLAAPPSPDGLAARMLADGRLQPHPCGIGYRFDDECRPLGANGDAPEVIRFVGPVTAGHFGDPLGGVFIEMQIRRMLPDLLGRLGA